MNTPIWIVEAWKYLGQKETPGPKTTSFIAKWLAKLKAWWTDDETPWCGVAVAGVLKDCGIDPPFAYYRALAWLQWGMDLGRMYGAIVVLGRTGGGHVGFVTGMTSSGSHIRIMGGNQGDRYCEAWFQVSRVLGYRWPKGQPTSGPLPIVELGSLSRSES